MQLRVCAVKVVNIARAPSRNAWAANIAKLMHGFHMGELQGARTLVLRRESKIFNFLFRPILRAHVKNFVPKCSQIPHELLFFYLRMEPHTI